jgi:surface protein
VHHTTVATGGNTPGYYMATCSGPRPGVCQGMNSIATSSFNLKGISMDDNRIRTAVAAWLADATVAEATYGHISTWETGEVTDMEELFHRASSFNEDIGAWNTSGVTTMEDMFSWAYAFDQPIGTWSVGAVTNMNRVFEGASAFNQDIGHWPVDSVIDMKKMFSEASAFNQDLSDWRLDSVTDIDRMFYKASAFDQDLGWCVDYGVSIEGAFESSGCESTSCGVTHGICWGRGTNRSGVGLVLVIVICLLLAICVPLAISFCFLAGTGGACIRFCWAKHKKTQMDGVAGAAPTVSNSTDAFF